jgi:anaerobic selenocysteine-containing dehydrogenase
LTAADTQAVEAAFRKLELLVVIDVSHTETSRLAHYVLPASSQFEKWETTFFNLEFPTQAFHLRRPLLPSRPGTLPEPEIYRRLLVAMGELPERFPLLAAVARLDRRWPRLRLFPAALAALLARKPRLRPYAASILYQTLGRELPGGAAAAAPLWFTAHEYARRHAAAVRRTGLSGTGAALGEALFERILTSPSGALLSTHEYEDTWRLIRHADGRIHLEVPEMLKALRALHEEPDPSAASPEYPFVLIAGERRAYNANQIYRDPAWRKTDPDGALHIHPEDARGLGLAEGGLALCESARGTVTVRVHLTDAIRPGVVSLPHGYGMEYSDGSGGRRRNGPAVNLLTESSHRDPLTATPYHKHVRVRLRPAA